MLGVQASGLAGRRVRALRPSRRPRRGSPAPSRAAAAADRLPDAQPVRRVAPPRGPRHRPARRPPGARRRAQRAATSPSACGSRRSSPTRRSTTASPGSRTARSSATASTRRSRASARTRAPFAVLLVDLDGFKQRQRQPRPRCRRRAPDGSSPARFEDAVRPGDTLARLGGDEFALLLDGADERQAIGDRAAGCSSALAEPVDDRRPRARRSARASASPSTRAGRRPSDELIRGADVAMYAAKEAGRGRVEVFRHEHGPRARRVARPRARAAPRAPARRVRASTTSRRSTSTIGRDRRRRGARALASPTRGPVPPAEFIPLAEATGLIRAARRARAARGVPRRRPTWRRDGLLPDRLRHLGQRLGATARRPAACSALVEAVLDDGRARARPCSGSR